MRENSLSGSANLFKGVNAIGNFRRFELSRVNLSHGSQKLVPVIESLENSRVHEIGGRNVELE